MRTVSTLLLTILSLYGAWWLWHNNPQLKEMIPCCSDCKGLVTLEARYTPKQIMAANKRKLISSKTHSFGESELRFYPYLMMEVKYLTGSGSTGEGIILWGLEDGEMVLDTETWETSNGFEDCIACDANATDIKIIQALAKEHAATRDQLRSLLKIDGEALDASLSSARAKHLVVQNGNVWQLHFHNPKFDVQPNTRIGQWLVTKPYDGTTRAPKRYDAAQVRRLAKAVFGEDFAIRSEQEVFLPVYTIRVNNPDGSTLTTYWNALNGKQLQPRAVPGLG